MNHTRINRAELQNTWRTQREDWRSGLLAWALLCIFIAGILLAAIVIGR